MRSLDLGQSQTYIHTGMQRLHLRTKLLCPLFKAVYVIEYLIIARLVKKSIICVPREKKGHDGLTSNLGRIGLANDLAFSY